MYLFHGDKHVLFVDPDRSIRDKYRIKRLRLNQTLWSSVLAALLPMVIFAGIGVATILQDEHTLAGWVLTFAGIAALMASVGTYMRNKRFYNELVRTGRAIDLDESIEGRGLMLLLFAGDRAISRASQLSVLGKESMELFYSSSHPLYAFLDDRLNRKLLRRLGATSYSAAGRQRLIAILEPRANEVIAKLLPEIQENRDAALSMAQFESDEINRLLDELGIREVDPASLVDLQKA